MSNGLIYIEASEETPMVKQELVDDTSTFSITGISIPENTLEFYEPLLQQMASACSASKNVSLIFHLEYMNSMSNKQVLKLISLIHKNNPKLTVVWKYTGGDDLIRMKGEEMKTILDGVNFSVVEA